MKKSCIKNGGNNNGKTGKTFTDHIMVDNCNWGDNDSFYNSKLNYYSDVYMGEINYE